MNISPRRRAIIDRINQGGYDIRPGEMPKRDDIPPPSDEILQALYDVAQSDYGKLYGKKTCGFFKRKKWGTIYYLTLRTYFGLGLRPSEGVYLRVMDFNFDEGYVWIRKADTLTGEPKGKRRKDIPVPLTPFMKELLMQIFKDLKLGPNDYILSGGRRERTGAPLPISIATVEYRFKEVATAAAQKYPNLKIDPTKIFPYQGRRKVAKEITDQQKDRGVMASEILGHDKSDGKIVLGHYDIHTKEELQDAMTGAVDKKDNSSDRSKNDMTL